MRIDCATSPPYPLVTARLTENEKEEDMFVDAQSPTLSFADLPDDVLGMIFERAIFANNYQTDLKAVDGIRNMGSRYYNILENWVLKTQWSKLQTALTHPEEIPNPIIRASFCSVHVKIPPESCNEAPALRPSLSNTYFRAFFELHQSLKEKNVVKSMDLSLGVWGYKKVHKKINNIALKTMFDQVHHYPYFQQAPFNQKNVKGNQIHTWLNDPQYAEGIAASLSNYISFRSTNPASLQAIPIFPVELAKFSSLEVLEINRQQLKGISDTTFDHMGRFTQLKSLYLRFNELTDLPNTINRLSQLELLNLSGNQITRLPDSIGQLSHLTALDLTGNAFEDFPDVIRQLNALQYLDLEGNRLTTIPPIITDLTRLQTLNLSYNRLRDIPPTIGELRELRLIDLSNNKLINIPSSITKLSKLGTSPIEDSMNFRPLRLNNNPLVFSIMKGNMSLQEFKDAYAACSACHCQTPLATLCKQIHLNADKDVLLQAFNALPPEMQRNIEAKLASTPSNQASSSNDPWNPTNDLLSDKPRFIETVTEFIRWNYHALSTKELRLLDRWILVLAGQLTPALDAEWAESEHTSYSASFQAILSAAANSIRIIEAMERMFNGQFPTALSLEGQEAKD